MWRSGVVALGLSLAHAAAPARAEEPKRTPEQVARKGGVKLIKSISLDFDGDGRDETVGACEGERGVRLCVFGEDEQGATLAELLPLAGGITLKELEAKDLHRGRPGQEVLLEVYDETPDEKVKRIRIYSGFPKTREIFTSVIFRQKKERARPEWEADDVVKYGDARPGWYFWDRDDDGVDEIFVRRKAQLLRVPRATDGPAKLLTGVRESVYAFTEDDAGGRYQERDKDMFRDFLPAYDVARVTGSGAFVPKEELENLQAEAMAAAVYGDAAGAQLGDIPKVDLSPYFARAADRNLSTAWVENDPKGAGKGEWIALDLDAPKEIHMVRIVGGCVDDAQSYRGHNVPRQLEVRFDSGERSLVDTRNVQSPDRPAVAILQTPLKDRPWASQLLVFFHGKVKSQKVRITIEEVARQGRANQTCISEVSVH